MKTFYLDNQSIEISSEREEYNTLRLKYQQLAKNAEEDFRAKFSNNFKNMDELHEKCNDIVQKYLLDAVGEAIKDLIASDIIDVGDDYFISKYLTTHLSWEDDFGKIDEKYMEIVLNEKELDEYRATRNANSSGGVMGGGFGLEGAAQGAAIAMAANLAMGVIGGVFSAGSKAFSTLGNMHLKSELYNNPDLRNHLYKSVFKLVFQVHFGLIDAFKDKKISKYFSCISKENEIKANSIIENINKERITKGKIKSAIIEAMKQNPYEPSLYLLWMNHFGDSDYKLELFAKYFGVEFVYEYKLQMLLDYKDKLKFSTLKECQDSLLKLKNYACSNGLGDIYEDESKSIELLIKHLDIESRTANGKVFDTQKEAEREAELLKKRLKDEELRSANGFIYPTKEMAEKSKKINFLLGLSIVIAPLPNTFSLFQSGYSFVGRFLSFVWTVIYSYSMFSPDNPLAFAMLIVSGILVLVARLTLEEIVAFLYKQIRTSKGIPIDKEGDLRTIFGFSYRKSEIVFYIILLLLLFYQDYPVIKDFFLKFQLWKIWT